MIHGVTIGIITGTTDGIIAGILDGVVGVAGLLVTVVAGVTDETIETTAMAGEVILIMILSLYQHIVITVTGMGITQTGMTEDITELIIMVTMMRCITIV